MFSLSDKLWQSVGAAALVLACTSTQTAHAAGIEDTVAGGVGLGRAASYGQVNDFMAVLQNPANLAVVPRGSLDAELRLPILRACYSRQYDPRLYDPATGKNEYKQVRDAAGNVQLVESFEKICNDALPLPTANLGWAKSYSNGLGWGIGLFTPAGVGNTHWKNGLIRTVGQQPDPYTRTDAGVETATRQMAIEREGVIAHLMLGLGWQPVKQIRIGASGGVGFGSVKFTSVASVLGGTFRDQEIVQELNVSDWMIPRATASLVVNPFAGFEMYGVAQWQDDIKAKGYVDLTANGITGAPLQSCSKKLPTDPEPGTHCRINGVRLDLPMNTWEFTGGLRYGHRRTARERVLDPMKDEVFDIEVNATWSQSSNVDTFTANIHNKETSDPTAPQLQFGNNPTSSRTFPQKQSIIPKHWKDTWTVRAGFDYNVVPEVFTFRLGGSYATAAVDPAYMNIDAFPVEKIGAHLGGTLQLGNYRLTLAYAHFFQSEVTVPVGTGKVLDIATASPELATAVNEGKFWSALDVISVQLGARFK